VSTIDRLMAELKDMHPYSRGVRLGEIANDHGEGFAKALERQLAERDARLAERSRRAAATRKRQQGRQS
jgi:hypothetical protein